MPVKMILPALTEAKSPYWRPIKYSLFPPLGLATLAGYFPSDIEIVLQDEHVEEIDLTDEPELVIVQVYITSARRAYEIADHYRSKGSHVALGGLHVTSLPDEAAKHADTVFLGPGEDTFSQFLNDFFSGNPKQRYESRRRTLVGIPRIRRDLIKRYRYLVPNSIVVSRGCPHHCDFCYKDAFFDNGTSFYVQQVEDAVREIERLPGRHLYFLDDHLFGNRRFAAELFTEMNSMNRVFQGAATVDSILRGDLIEKAAAAGLRSLFVGFETLSTNNLKNSNKHQNLGRDYRLAIERLHQNGIMINGSFVFGLDDDDEDVFARTVDWAVENALTTATFHILTPYPGTQLFKRMDSGGRILTKNWDLYDTRHVVFKTARLQPEKLKAGYDWSYREFYKWSNIFRASASHESLKHALKHFAYTAGWKKFETTWNFLIKFGQLNRILPLLEAVLSEVNYGQRATREKPLAAIQPVPAKTGCALD